MPDLAFFDRHPVLERLEANRIEHLARGYLRQTELWKLEQRLARQQALLQRLLDSSAFAVAERLSARWVMRDGALRTEELTCSS